MSLLIEDEFNTIEGMEKRLEERGLLDKVKELYSRGIRLTPIQANMLFLDYPNFGGRAYGKSYMSLIVRFSRANERQTGYQFVYLASDWRDLSRTIDFVKEYYKEFEIVQKKGLEVLIRKVR